MEEFRLPKSQSVRYISFIQSIFNLSDTTPAAMQHSSSGYDFVLVVCQPKITQIIALKLLSAKLRKTVGFVFFPT